MLAVEPTSIRRTVYLCVLGCLCSYQMSWVLVLLDAGEPSTLRSFSFVFQSLISTVVRSPQFIHVYELSLILLSPECSRPPHVNPGGQRHLPTSSNEGEARDQVAEGSLAGHLSISQRFRHVVELIPLPHACVVLSRSHCSVSRLPKW